MATNTAGTTARTLYSQQLGYVSRRFNYNSGFVANTTAFTVGTLPAGCVVVDAGVIVGTAFTMTNKTLDIGTAADPDGFATALALGTIGRIPADELATSDDLGPYAADVVITATPTLNGGTNTAGVGVVWVTFIPANDFV